MDERRIEIIFHLLIFAYFFGDSDLLQNGGGWPRIFTIVVIYIIPSESYALLTSSFDWTRCTEETDKCLELVGVGFEGRGPLESSEVKLIRKGVLNAKHFTNCEVETELLVTIRGEIKELEKLFEIILFKEHRISVLLLNFLVLSTLTYTVISIITLFKLFIF